ncbi:MAG TPA: hypothetical protein VMU11_00395 [Verrucomicrobiae bacterium]|nr:hypothetical protein [Verrucomicrobiae bacterium]
MATHHEGTHHAVPALKNPRVLLLIAAAIIIIVVACAGIAASGYVYHVESGPMIPLIGWLPAARVGSQTVTYAQYLQHVQVQRTFIEGPAARDQGVSTTFDDTQRSAALERAIRIAAIDDMAMKAGIQATPLDVERAYLGLVDRAGTSTTPQEIHDFLHDQFGMDENEFKQLVVRPALLEDTLRQAASIGSSDPNAFDTQLQARLGEPDVVRYIRFTDVTTTPSLANTTST